MVKCPFCHFDNEDGALFCETCKSDLAGVESATPVVEAIPMAVDVLETVPLMEVHEASPVIEPMSATLAEPILSAEPYVGEAVGVEAVEVEAVAVEAVVESIPMATAMPPHDPADRSRGGSGHAGRSPPCAKARGPATRTCGRGSATAATRGSGNGTCSCRTCCSGRTAPRNRAFGWWCCVA